MKRVSFLLALIAAACLMAAGAPPPLSHVELPGGGKGIGFDDLGFSPALGRVMVPGGRTGALFLIDPESQKIEQVNGFSATAEYRAGHGEGITSADAGRGVIFVTDRTSQTLNVVDSGSRKIAATAKLASGPDYVRYVAATKEVWVTEPGAARVEIFTLGDSSAPSHSGFIPVPNGPESLVVDNDGGRAYSNEWGGWTLAIDLKRRAIVSRWRNRCNESRGIALDTARSLVFVGCEEGKLSALDTHSGRVLGRGGSVAGVDIIGYNPALHHVYLPGADSASTNVIDVSDPAAPRVLATIATAKGAHCAVADDKGGVYVCDPRRGRLLLMRDNFGR